MSSTTPLRCLSRRRPLPHAAQPAFEIQTTSLSPPSQTPEGLLLETTDVRKGKQDPPTPRVSPPPSRAPPLPTIRRAGKGTRAQPSVSFQPSTGARQMQRSQPASRPSAAAARWVPQARARRIAPPLESGWQPGEGVVQERRPGEAAWRVPGPVPWSPGPHRRPIYSPSPPKPTPDTPPARDHHPGGPWVLHLIRLVTGGDG